MARKKCWQLLVTLGCIGLFPHFARLDSAAWIGRRSSQPVLPPCDRRLGWGPRCPCKASTRPAIAATSRGSEIEFSKADLWHSWDASVPGQSLCEDLAQLGVPSVLRQQLLEKALGFAARGDRFWLARWASAASLVPSEELTRGPWEVVSEMTLANRRNQLAVSSLAEILARTGEPLSQAELSALVWLLEFTPQVGKGDNQLGESLSAALASEALDLGRPWPADLDAHFDVNLVGIFELGGDVRQQLFQGTGRLAGLRASKLTRSLHRTLPVASDTTAQRWRKLSLAAEEEEAGSAGTLMSLADGTEGAGSAGTPLDLLGEEDASEM
ncbi:unnamed protein product [Polarella glacialis]|uniref:Uncharacterized protein n=1 Tax=Polarella glacialis TaxID=89957 RepID=A0A813H8J8_POLGL|nr:unnamed protein product [Polarella glacialis]